MIHDIVSYDDVKDKSSNWSTYKGIDAVKKEQNSWVVIQVSERVILQWLR